jgi:hypothetical protein
MSKADQLAIYAAWIILAAFELETKQMTIEHNRLTMPVVLQEMEMNREVMPLEFVEVLAR